MSAEKLPTDGYELGPGWKVGRGNTAIYVNPRSGYCAFPDDAEAMGAIVRKAEAPTHAFEPSRFGDYCGREVDGDYCKRGRAHAVHEASKAEAPTFEQVLEGATAALEVLGTGALREKLVTEGPRTYAAPPEQPSGNAGELGERPTCDTPGCGCPIPVGGEGHPEICPTCLAAEAPAAPVGEPSEARHLAHAFVTANRLDCEKERPSPEPRPEHFPLCDRLTDVIQRAIDPRDARIAALEAELAARLVERDGWMEAAAKSEREKGALEAELAEAKRGTLVVAETAYGATQAAVQAEREVWKARIMRFRDDGHMLQSDLFAYLNSDGNEEADRIKNGDPAP